MELQICMIPSPEDVQWRSADYQSELRNLGSTLRADGLEIWEMGSRSVGAGESSLISGEWRVKFNTALAPVLEAPVRTWLEARRGRMVKLRIGEIEADVWSVRELIRVIKVAGCYQAVIESES